MSTDPGLGAKGTWGVLCHGTQELLLLLPALV